MCVVLMAQSSSDIGDFHTLVGVHRAAFGPGYSLNSGLSGQRAAAAMEVETSFHRVVVGT